MNICREQAAPLLGEISEQNAILSQPVCHGTAADNFANRGDVSSLFIEFYTESDLLPYCVVVTGDNPGAIQGDITKLTGLWISQVFII